MDLGVLCCEVDKNCYVQHKAGLLIIIIIIIIIIIGSTALGVPWAPRDYK